MDLLLWVFRAWAHVCTLPIVSGDNALPNMLLEVADVSFWKATIRSDVAPLDHDLVAINSIWHPELHFKVGWGGFTLCVSTLRVVGIGRKVIEVVADKVEKVVRIVKALLG